jgi:hypothetical protein
MAHLSTVWPINFDDANFEWSEFISFKMACAGDNERHSCLIFALQVYVENFCLVGLYGDVDCSDDQRLLEEERQKERMGINDDRG